MILRRQNPVLENMYSGRYQINKKNIYVLNIEYWKRCVSAFVVCLAFILSFSSFSLSALCKKNHLRSSVSFLCLFCTILPKPAYCYLCAISLIFLLDLCSLVPSSRSAVCFMLSLCYLCAISVLSMLSYSGSALCFMLSLCYLCAIDGLSCWGMFFALYYLCAISVLSLLSLCYRLSVMLGGVVGSVLSLCYLCAIDGLSCWGMFFALRYLCAISVLFLINLCRYIAQTGRRSYPP